MAKKRKGPGGGNPATRAQPKPVTNPCPKCGTRSRARGALWCLTCSETARKRGVRNAKRIRPSRAVVAAVAAELGLDL